MKPNLLIIDDDDDIRSQMKWALAADYEISMAGDRASAIERSSVRGGERPWQHRQGKFFPPERYIPRPQKGGGASFLNGR